jgi:pimeloyl-ACP methyl ester carboxylesterase
MKLVIDGREAYAYTGGKPFDPALPTVVFVHGAMCDHGAFTLLARWFAHHGRSVLAVDLPGHMRSDGPALTSVEAMADWLLGLLGAAGVRRAALVGHSLGSLIALEAAARSATRSGATIEQLVMIGTCVPMPVPKALIDLARRDVHAAIDRVVSFSFSSLAAKPSYPGPGVWLRGTARSLMRIVAAHASSKGEGSGSDLFVTDFSACHDYAAGMASAAKVACTAHLILGDLDQMTLPRAATDVAAVLEAQVHRLAGGHFLMQELPDAVLNVMRKALG